MFDSRAFANTAHVGSLPKQNNLFHVRPLPCLACRRLELTQAEVLLLVLERRPSILSCRTLVEESERYSANLTMILGTTTWNKLISHHYCEVKSLFLQGMTYSLCEIGVWILTIYEPLSLRGMSHYSTRFTTSHQHPSTCLFQKSSLFRLSIHKRLQTGWSLIYYSFVTFIYVILY